ncbi:hypothetical protein GCM10019059_40180 [Camelimonas fluminis]|uniref:Glycosyltransferase n=1 Tax=Camelimonas fluminis TaxID=1576911 RepID=A0ABV7UH22_9HYPH|nr:glycosyltransferase [Camelimonas fluminis]GHE76958.1 hypothetical protein GCM10019059_40180 [Camelimonas fluminis]
MTENTDIISERPLVTFALFAYNQEKYIREAIEGAFSQSYEPLEIILSDDVSSDRTFEIMQEMAAEYQGRHRVMVRRTHTNLRPYSHVLDVAQRMNGQLMILAAGDDISKPERVQEIVDTWIRTNCWAVHSRYDTIDEAGNVLALGQRSQSLLSPECDLRTYFFSKDGPIEVVHGATSAYDIQLFQQAPANSAGILSEDGVFTIILNALRGSVSFVESSLVRYRVHTGAISNTGLEYKSINDTRKAIKKEGIYAKNIVDRAELLLHFAEVRNDDIRKLNTAKLKDEIIFYRSKFEWNTLTYTERVTSILLAWKRNRIGFLISGVFGEQCGAIYLFVRQTMGRFFRKKGAHHERT